MHLRSIQRTVCGCHICILNWNTCFHIFKRATTHVLTCLIWTCKHIHKHALVVQSGLAIGVCHGLSHFKKASLCWLGHLYWKGGSRFEFLIRLERCIMHYLGTQNRVAVLLSKLWPKGFDMKQLWTKLLRPINLRLKMRGLKRIRKGIQAFQVNNTQQEQAQRQLWFENASKLKGNEARLTTFF